MENRRQSFSNPFRYGTSETRRYRIFDFSTKGIEMYADGDWGLGLKAQPLGATTFGE